MAKKKQPYAIVFSGYGLNCEDETKAALESVGAKAGIIHLHDIIARPALLNKADILVLGGGFAYGDYTGSGKAYGNRMRQHLDGSLEEFLQRDTLMIGICNGFQILTSAGILPGALIGNDPPRVAAGEAGGGRYLCRWVDLEVTGNSPWLEDMSHFSLPIAHGEGKYYIPAETLAELSAGGGSASGGKKDNAIALRYVEGEMSKHFDLPANPNGSLENIAGVTVRGGRVLGLMPHPERAVSFFQLPHWTYLKEKHIRAGEKLPTSAGEEVLRPTGSNVPSEGPGLQIFRNAVNYFS